MSGLELLIPLMMGGGGAAAAGVAGGAAAAASTAGTLATVAQIGGTALSMVGALKSGADQKASLNYQAQVREQQADESMAAGQRSAEAQYRQGRLLQSRQQAIAAATGGGADQSVLNMMGMTAMETQLAAQTEIYKAEQQSKGYTDAASVSRIDAKRAGTNGTLTALSSGFNGASTMYNRFARNSAYATNGGNYG